MSHADLVQRLRDGSAVYGDLAQAAAAIELLVRERDAARERVRVLEVHLKQKSRQIDALQDTVAKYQECTSERITRAQPPAPVSVDRTAELLLLISVLRDYPDFDGGGPLADAMDQALRGEPVWMLQAIDHLAHGYAPPAPVSVEPVAWREVVIGPGSPELDEPILTWNGNYGVHVLTRIGTELFWDDGITSALPMHDRYAPTHWMPLPAQPASEQPAKDRK